MSNEFGIEIDESVLVGFIDESKDSLDSLDSLFVSLEQSPEDSQIINSIFRPIHSIKGNAPFFGFMKLKNITHELESLLAGLRDKKIKSTKTLIDLMLVAVDEIKGIFNRIAERKPEILDQEKFETLISRIKSALTDSEPCTIKQEQHLSAQDSTPAAQNENKHPANNTKSMRIAEERIDTFLSFVGELVIAQDMLRHFTVKLRSRTNDEGVLKDLNVITSVISTLGNELEKAIMSIRKVPIKSLLQKIPRLVRDVAKLKNKDINVVIEGDTIEIDKSLVELLDAPLTHMSRNAADHGIEPTEVRKKKGKKPEGLVQVKCIENATEILISITDDGAGLNLAALQKKAESLGIVQPGVALNEMQIINLIFMAGVSTASEVSDVSGRGVGMDVVKRNIESAGGEISVKTEADLGTQFIIKLPKSVTTQIIHGLLIKNSDVDVVIPLDRVREIWYYNQDQVTNVATKGACIKKDEHVLPILYLNEYLGTSIDLTKTKGLLMLTVDTSHSQIAVSIDKVVGMRQLVIKPLDNSVNLNNIFLGGALLGDGNVALVLDVDKLD